MRKRRKAPSKAVGDEKPIKQDLQKTSLDKKKTNKPDQASKDGTLKEQLYDEPVPLSKAEEMQQREEARLARLARIPAPARRLFERRRQELLKQAENGELREDDGGLSLSFKLDLLVLTVAMFVLGCVLYKEYKINCLELVHGFLVRLLDPGLPTKENPHAS